MSVSKVENNRDDIDNALKKLIRESADYKYAVDQSCIVVISDKEGIIKYVNDNFCRISKYKREELIGREHGIINSGYHSKEFIQNLWITIAKGDVWRGEIKNMAKDGTYFWVDTSIVPFLNKYNKPIQYVAIKSDITERKKVEEQQMVFGSIINSSHFAIISMNLDGIITSWNYGAEKTFGYSFDEIMGKLISVLIPYHLFNGEKEIIQQIKSGKSIDPYRTERIKKNGQIIYVSLSVFPVKDLIGNIIGVSKIFHDITESRKGEEEIIRLNQGIVKIEKRFQGLIENSFDLVLVCDENFNPFYLNPACLKITGGPKTEGSKMGTPIEAHPDDIYMLKNIMKKVSNTPSVPFTIGFRAKHKDGHYVFVEGAITNMLQDDAIKGIVLNLKDITETKKAERHIIQLNSGLEQKVEERSMQLSIVNEELESNMKKLRESEELYFKIFEISPVGISIGEIQSGIIIDVNDNFLQMTGYSRNEVIGHTSLELGLFSSNEGKRIKQELTLAGKVKEKEITVRKKSGENITALLSLDQFSVGDRKYSVTICYNISERKKAENERATANKDLQAFTYSVSHDLKTPLTIISSSASVLEMLLKNKLDEEGSKFFKKIKRHSMLMGQLINDLLELSRYSQITSFSKVKVDMKKLVEEVVDELKLNYGSIHINIQVNDLSSAYANIGLIRQVWINLISNALKYSRHKENSFIEISSKETKGEIVYSIKDNGAGFDMKEYNKLFGVFQRLHSDDEFEGTGIGLAIVQRIVFNHKGKAWAKGKTGKGATFYFSLPNLKV